MAGKNFTAPTCKETRGRYYKSCIFCGLSAEGIAKEDGLDIYRFFSDSPKHHYALCVEPTTFRYGLKYCTNCGRQDHVARISDHVHDWERVSMGYYVYDWLYGAPSTLLDYQWYVKDELPQSGLRPHHYLFKQQLKDMDEAGKYYYKNGKPAGLIDDEYLFGVSMGNSFNATVYYRCRICGDRQNEYTLHELYGEDAICGTNDTVYSKK